MPATQHSDSPFGHLQLRVGLASIIQVHVLDVSPHRCLAVVFVLIADPWSFEVEVEVYHYLVVLKTIV